MKTNRNLIIVTIITLLAVFASCHRYEYSPQLVEADSLCDVKPDSALKILHLMAKDTTGMNDDNLYYYYLLTLKAADKSFIPHTSDTLARRIVAHYEEDGDERLLPEVYYYAGRVYRDLSDAPQALDYLQKALDLMENDTTNLKLKSVVYSQMGYTAYLCNLYDKALEMHRGCYNCAVHAKDTVGMICGLMDMATCQEMRHHLDSAEVLYSNAMKLAQESDNNELEASLHTQISVMLLSLGKNNDALSHIRKSLEYDNPNNRSVTYSVARNIYDKLGNEDSAFLYSIKALKYGTIYARQKSYGWLSTYYNKNHNSNLSLLYGNLYKKTTDSIFDKTATEAVARMNSLYNYQIREKENVRLKTEKEKSQKLIVILTVGIIFATTLAIIIIMYAKEKRRALHYKLEKYEQIIKEYETIPSVEKQARQETIDSTDILRRIHHILNAPERTERLTDNEWNELRKTINTIYKDFDEKLQDLCRMSRQEYQVCLLLKAGISQVDIAYLLIKSESAISSIRRRLHERAFGKVKNAKEWDDFIHSL